SSRRFGLPAGDESTQGDHVLCVAPGRSVLSLAGFSRPTRRFQESTKFSSHGVACLIGGNVPARTSKTRPVEVIDWAAAIHSALTSQRVRQVSYVPDAGHKRLIELCHADKDRTVVPLTTEEEGIGLAAGAWLGGERAALLMQSSGVGNCVNALTLAANCAFPLLALVTMRGERGELNPWQIPMGQAAPGALRLIGVRTMGLRGALLVGAGRGSAAWDCTAAGDHPLTFPLWGAMGSACMMGLGLALAQPKRRVLVVTGDGEMLMGLGSLATVGVQRPANLAVVVLDNERYGETGLQKTHTGDGRDLRA